MKKILLLVLFASLLPSVSLAQSTKNADVDRSGQSSCVELFNNLRYKMRDANTRNEVSELQDFLSAEGYLDSSPTGYFGLGTQKAVKKFQSTAGLSPTGYVGALTREKIKEISCATSAAQSTKRNPVVPTQTVTNTVVGPATAPLTTPTSPESLFSKKIYPGMTDPEVKKLQTMLAMDGSIYPERAISGVYDFYTVQAVKKFQDRYNLATPELRTTPNYGAIGPKTTTMLYKVFVEKSMTAPPATTAPVAELQNQLTQVSTAPVNSTPKYSTLTVSNGGGGIVSSSPAGINCPTSCAASYETGSTITLTTIPNSGYVFDGWSDACSGTAPCIVSMYAARNAVATFIPVITQQQTTTQQQANTNTQQTPVTLGLSVAKSGTGTGTVSSSAGISCGATCSANVAKDTNVTLTATASADSVFSNWTGACTGTGSCVVVMSAAQNVNAVFTLIPPTVYALNVSGGTGGTVTSSPSGISCGATCTTNFNSGTSVTLTASAGTGYTFTGWSGACSGTTATCAVSMTGAKNVTATFTANQAPQPTVTNYTLSVTKSGTGTGSVASPSGISCGTTCSASLAQGTAVTLTATPDANSTFTGWSGVCTGTTTNCSTTMSVARSVTATFTLIPTYTITATQSANGTITPSAAATVIQGGSQSYTITPNAGYDIAGLLIDGVQALAANLYQFTNVQGNHTISATFAPITQKLTVVSGAGGTIASNSAGISCGTTCSYDFQQGTQVTLTATANTGYTFTNWTGCTGTGNTCTVTMDASKNVSAVFTAPAPAVSLTANPASITLGQATTLTWSSTNATSCTATGGWTTSTATSGTQLVSPTANQTYSISCTGTGGITNQSVNVTVATPSSYTLTVTGGTGGVVSSSPAGIICGTTCSSSFNSGATVTLLATPDIGYNFTGWSGACAGTTPSCVTTMSASQNAIAGFALIDSSGVGVTNYSFDNTLKQRIVFAKNLNSVFVSTASDLYAINVGTGVITKVSSNAVDFEPRAYDPVNKSVWGSGWKQISKIDVNTGTRTNYSYVPNSSYAYNVSDMEFDPSTNSIWVLGHYNLVNVPAIASKVSSGNGAMTDYPLGDTTAYNLVFDPSTNSMWAFTSSYAGPGVVASNANKINNGVVTPFSVGNAAYHSAIFDSVSNSIFATGIYYSGGMAHGVLSKINPGTGAKTDSFFGGQLYNAAFDSVTNSVWVQDPGVQTNLIKVNAGTGVQTNYPVGATSIYDMIFDSTSNSIWTTRKGMIVKMGVNTSPSVLSQSLGTLSLVADKTSITVGQSFNLSWNSTVLTSCTAYNGAGTWTSDPWSGPRAVNGVQTVATNTLAGINYGGTNGATGGSFGLNCTGPGGNLGAYVIINIAPLTIIIP